MLMLTVPKILTNLNSCQKKNEALEPNLDYTEQFIQLTSIPVEIFI